MNQIKQILIASSEETEIHESTQNISERKDTVPSLLVNIKELLLTWMVY